LEIDVPQRDSARESAFLVLSGSISVGAAQVATTGEISMQAVPRVSIIIPCYNAARTVAETIESALAQSETTIEVVAVDDGATDRTADILLSLAAQHTRLRVVRQRNGGLAAARNAGIAAARAEFIALLDADDVIDRDYVAQHLQHMAEHNLDISFSRVRYIDVAGTPTGAETNPPLDGLKAEDFLISNPCTAFLVIRRSVFERFGAFDPDFRRVEDQEWLFRAVFGGARIRGMPATLAGYRIMPGSLSADTMAMQRAFDAMLERAREIAPELVAQHETYARARMLRYCARRVMDHGGKSDDARTLMLRSLAMAPQLVLWEPKSTLATLVAAYVPRLQGLIFGVSHRPVGGAA
jgi:glycosyltransferase involved in cell wall biosynthesis